MEAKKEFELISYREFKIYCDDEFCLRKTIKSENCLKEYKREECYKKYLNNLKVNWNKFQNKINKNEEFRKKIIIRDKTCRVWNILNNAERFFILNNFYDDYIINSIRLEVCHAISRARASEKIFDEDNVFLASKYFHKLLDTYKDLITQEIMSNEKRNEWINRIMIENNIWS